MWQLFITFPYPICGAATTPTVWINNVTWKQWPPGIFIASAAAAGWMWLFACAVHIAAGHNIEEAIFDQANMRSHLIECLQQKLLSPSPQTKKKVKQSIHSNIVIPVYCHCGKPDSLDEMIQCDACDVWFHFMCAHIDTAPDSDWFCCNCYF